AEGVIIPQGIFEKIDYSLGEYKVEVDTDLLLERERQVHNLIKERKWVCFLISQIIDFLPDESGTRLIRDTDLCKRLLNLYGVSRYPVDGFSSLQAKDDEFKLYIHNYGVAQTVLELSLAQDFESQAIAKAEDYIVAAELLNQLFFLPFHTTKRDSSTAKSIVVEVTQAILDYRQKRIVEIPAWADEFQFKSEENLYSEIGSLLEQLNERQSELQSWRDHKAILTTSGDILKNKLIRILENFFQLKIDPIDENREDAKIIDDGGNTLVLIEAKGTKKGIKREHVNQVDSHRERNELSTSIPAVLFINNEMSVNRIEERLETKVPDEQIKHAKNLNILIVRTIDLLFLMRHVENRADRKDELMRLLLSGGGWLRAD